MSKIYTSCLCAFFFFITSLSAQLTVTTDKPDATYSAGQQMNFVINGGFGTATYVIRYDRGQAPNITEGTVQVSGTGYIPFKLDEPGMVFCTVTLNGQSTVCGAAFSPFDIQPFEDDPADFDSFWQGWKNQLAAVPINPVVTPLFPDPNVSTDDYRINLGMIDGRRVYGYLTVPKGGGSYPAVITHASFGGNAHLCIPRPEVTNNTGDVISLSIWMHNTQPDQEDFNAYKPEIFNDANGIYYRYGVLGVIRAIDYIFTMPEFDGTNLGLHGISEGGAMSLLAAGIDNRVKFVASSVFSMGEHTGFKYDRASGFPFFIVRGATTWPIVADENVVNATKYYDVVRAAKRYDGPFLGSVGFVDETVMPATNFSAYNQLKGSTVWIQKINGTHAGSTSEFNEVKYDFFRKHLNIPGNTGYVGDAGSDQNLTGNSVNLTGKIEINGQQVSNLPVEWKEVSGPGQVTFSNPFSANTTASFSVAGEYILRFSAKDESRLASDQAIFTITDHVKINTQSGVNPCAGDVTPPTASCKDVTVNLDALGNATLFPTQVENNSFDDCTATTSLIFTLNRTNFDCTDIGRKTVRLTVSDASGNSADCTARVTITENSPPQARCQNKTILLDANGDASLAFAEIDAGSFDNCTSSNDLIFSINKSEFDCTDVAGATSVELTVTDAAGNSSKCTSTISVSENLPPTAVCDPITIELDGNGNGNMTPQQFGGNSYDNCTASDDLRLTINRLNFGCWDVGTMTVMLTVNDAAGNVANCSADVTIRESSPPSALCKNITTQLDPTGVKAISPAEINGGSWDNCTPSVELIASVDRPVLSCTDQGVQTVRLTVEDASGNVASCDASVTLVDNQPPTAGCKDLTILLDANGEARVTPQRVNSGSVDNCPAALQMKLDRRNFNCSDIGNQTVVLSVSDASGNTSTCFSNIKINDSTPPNAACQDVSVLLDMNGIGQISTSDIDSGSVDNCTQNLIFSLSKTDFTCADSGSGQVVMTVTDASGNSADCTAFVQINETEAPTAVCQNLTIEIGAQSAVSLSAADLDAGSFDNCTSSLDLRASVDRNELTCNDLGLVSVMMTIEDGAGNTDVCQSEITVIDVTAPVPVCNDFAVTLDSLGAASIAVGDIAVGSFDNCSPSFALTFSLSKTDFTIDDLGANSVDLSVIDESGNIAGCTAQVTVERGISSTAFLAEAESEFIIYPNPASERVNIRFSFPFGKNGLNTLRVFNNLGQQIQTFSLEKMETEIDLQNLPTGIYHVLLFDENRQIGMRKLVIE